MLATTQEVIPNQLSIMDSKSSPVIIVPARLASVRFPRKLLADAGGKPLILRTAERIKEQVPEFDLYFAVDGDELGDVLGYAGYQTIATDPDLASGTDRIAFANRFLKRETVINIQADEPRVRRDHILLLVDGIAKPDASISTIASKFQSEKDFHDPNQVKVVMDQKGFAMYFSRSPIPYDREKSDWSQAKSNYAFKHIGLYGYKRDFLENFLSEQVGELEQIERLEQLRALQNGFRISVGITDVGSVGVDTPDDLKKISFS